MRLKKRYKGDRSDWVWQVDYYDEYGQRQRKSTKTKVKKEAEKIANDIKADIILKKNGIIALRRTAVDRTMTLESFREYYCKYLVGNDRTKSTIGIFEDSIKSLVRVLGNMPIYEIQIRHVEKWKSDAIKKSGERLSTTSVNIHQRTLKASFNVATKHNLILANPFKDVHLVRPACDDEIPKVFAPEEVQKLVGVIKAESQFFAWIVKLLLATGIRKGECIHLEVEDFDWEEHKLHIRNKPKFGFRTKTKRNRSIPINSMLQDLVEEMKSENAFPNEGLVFKSQRGKCLLNGNWLQRKFKDFVIKANLPEELSLHNLRHTHATTLIKEGASIYSVSKLLGHGSVRTTEKYYAHAMPVDFSHESNMISSIF